MTLIREDMYSVTASLDGVSLETWDKKDGGEIDSESSTHRPGAMGEPVALGGPRTYEAITISRGYDLQRDHVILPQLLAAAGNGEMTVVVQPLDRNKNAFGTPTTYVGTLKKVTPPDHDSDGNDGAMISLEIEVTSVT